MVMRKEGPPLLRKALEMLTARNDELEVKGERIKDRVWPKTVFVDKRGREFGSREEYVTRVFVDRIQDILAPGDGVWSSSYEIHPEAILECRKRLVKLFQEYENELLG
jgi:hypothetical protein